MSGDEILDRMEHILADHGKAIGLGSSEVTDAYGQRWHVDDTGPIRSPVVEEIRQLRAERDRLAEALRLTHTPRPCATKLMRDKCPACDALEALDA